MRSRSVAIPWILAFPMFMRFKKGHLIYNVQIGDMVKSSFLRSRFSAALSMVMLTREVGLFSPDFSVFTCMPAVLGLCIAAIEIWLFETMVTIQASAQGKLKPHEVGTLIRNWAWRVRGFDGT